MANQEAPRLSEEQRAAWVRDKFQAANKYLAEKGIITTKVLTKESRYVAPLVAVWKFETSDNKKVWVISGELPTDHVGVQAATNARDAMRHFALSWQMKAENILQELRTRPDQTQYQFAQLLIKRGEDLYSLVDDEALWQAEPV